MRTQTIAVLACLIVAIMLAAPAVANQPAPQQKPVYVTDDPPFDKCCCWHNYLILSQPVPAPFYPWIAVPVGGDPVLDEGPFEPLTPTTGSREQRVKQAG